jgi:hypothetical protein
LVPGTLLDFTRLSIQPPTTLDIQKYAFIPDGKVLNGDLGQEVLRLKKGFGRICGWITLLLKIKMQ